MVTMDTSNLSLALVWILFQRYLAAKSEEYCNGQRFRASCTNEEVVVMQNAVYGRMNIGKCIERDLGFLGCSANALKHLDTVCSNKISCEMVVSGIDIPVETTCPKDFTSYLKASYTCEKVLQFDCDEKPVILSGDNTLSSESLYKCGSSSKTFSAQPGQQLNISARYFDWDETSASTCGQHFGIIRDSISSNSVQLCSGSDSERHLMLSNGNSIDISLGSGANKGSFLLQVKILGCGDITAPAGGWVQRQGDELTMGCHSGKHTWTLSCVGNQWQGVTGQCGTDVAMAISKPQKDSIHFWGLSPGIMVFAVCSGLLFFSAVIFTIGVCVHVKRSEPAANISTYALYDEQRQCLTMQPGKLDPQRAFQGTLPLHGNSR